MVFFGFSLLNCYLGFFFSDFYLFFFRQVFLICAFSFTYFFDNHIKKFSEDYVSINSILTKRYALLRLETPLMLLSCCSVFVVSNVLTNNHFLYVFSALVLSSYFFLLVYRFICIYRTPEVRVYYRFTGFNNRRGFSTSASVLKLCAECGRFVGFGFIASYGIPKAIYGADYRSPVVNFVGYFFTGYKSDSEMVYSIANQYFSDDNSRILITESDGITISKQKLSAECIKRKLPIFSKYN